MSDTTRYVLGLLFDEEEAEVVLVVKSSPRWMRGRLNGVGGKVLLGEEPFQAMVREWSQASGDPPGEEPPQWRLFAELSGTVDAADGTASPWSVSCYRAQAEDIRAKVAHPQTHEGEFFIFMVPSSILKNRVDIIPNLRWLLPMAFSSCARDWPLVVQEKAYLVGGS